MTSLFTVSLKVIHMLISASLQISHVINKSWRDEGQLTSSLYFLYLFDVFLSLIWVLFSFLPIFASLKLVWTIFLLYIFFLCILCSISSSFSVSLLSKWCKVSACLARKMQSFSRKMSPAHDSGSTMFFLNVLCVSRLFRVHYKKLSYWQLA